MELTRERQEALGISALRMPEISPAVKTATLTVVLREEAPVFAEFNREGIHDAVPLWRRLRAEQVLLLSAPLSVAGMMVLAVGFLLATGTALHAREMLAAAATSVAVGIIAVLPLFQAMRLGDTEKMIQSAKVSIGLRMGLLLAGTFLAMGPGFGLQTIALIGWTMAFYFPLLAGETAVMAWILKKLDGPGIS